MRDVIMTFLVIDSVTWNSDPISTIMINNFFNEMETWHLYRELACTVTHGACIAAYIQDFGLDCDDRGKKACFWTVRSEWGSDSGICIVGVASEVSCCVWFQAFWLWFVNSKCFFHFVGRLIVIHACICAHNLYRCSNWRAEDA